MSADWHCDCGRPLGRILSIVDAGDACACCGRTDPNAHTPGPWATTVDGEGVCALGGLQMVAEMAGGSTFANARLIAAAPDLLEACIAIAEVFGIPADGCEDNPHAVMVRDAIRKATEVTS